MTQGPLIEDETLEQAFLKFSIEVQKKIPSEFQKKRKKVLVISGPTSVGKSELALDLAEKIGGEIVSCDSMQVYRGMNIGTAKPSLEEMLQVPHHLVDIREITDHFDVVQFYKEALFACQRIHERDNIPILVGGSGFYLHTFLYGPPNGPPPHPELRKKLEEEFTSKGADSLYQRLRSLDPKYAETISSNDKHKMIRALEIIEVTGKPVSSHAWKSKPRPQRFDFRCWFFNRPRESLYYRINKRCERMVEKGLIEETKLLIKQGLLENKTAASSIGYRQAIDFIHSEQSSSDLCHFLESFKKSTRHYAKRQLTWFKKESIFHWLDLDLHDPETILDIMLNDYERWEWEL